MSLVTPAIGGGMAATASDSNQKNLVDNMDYNFHSSHLFIYLFRDPTSCWLVSFSS